MITSFSIKNLGPIQNVEAQGLDNVNVIVGTNGKGKTHLLKALYSANWATEQYGRGIESRSFSQLLSSKLSTTFMISRLGELVSKGADEPLSFEMMSGHDEVLDLSFGKETTSSIVNVRSTFSTTDVNSVFIPAKEILSLQNIIKESRSSKFNARGFDDTYWDLANALTPTIKGKNVKGFADARKALAEALHGRLEFDNNRSEWFFKDENSRHINIYLAAEGVKKMSILDTLLGNHFLSCKSVIFIDEVESALHPNLISTFMELIADLSQIGLQFFLTTHSYTVIKKLYIIANRDGISIPCISLGKGIPMQYNLRDGLPQNEIIDASIKLYEEELNL